jgi:putative transposase
MPQHVIQRGTNRSVIFGEPSDYALFAEYLMAACERYGCRVHAYVFMSNHVHLVVTPSVEGGVSHVMKLVGVRYVQYFNRKYRRTGTLWEGRYRASLIQLDRYLLTCYRYIELNPVRAGLAKRADDYRWSSYRTNALGDEDPLVTPHETYLGLGATADARRAGYRALVEDGLSNEAIDDIRRATNAGLVLGSKRFRDEVAALLKRRAEPVRFGRRSRSNDALRV